MKPSGQQRTTVRGEPSDSIAALQKHERPRPTSLPCSPGMEVTSPRRRLATPTTPMVEECRYPLAGCELGLRQGTAGNGKGEK